MSGFVVEQFVAIARNTLVGFVTVRAPSGLIFHDAAVHRKGETWWVSPAAKAVLDRDGKHLMDSNGKKQFVPVVSFATRDARDRFSNGIIEALRTSRPEVFQ